MGCMCEKDYAGECKICGYADDGICLAAYLAPKTFLKNRYVIGKLVSYNGEAATYTAYDTTTETKVTIREYMPDALCSREKDEEVVSVNIDSLPLYKTYMSEYIELNEKLMNSASLTNIQTVLDVFTENNTAYVVMEYIVGISLKTFLANCGGSLTWDQAKEAFPPLLTTLGLIHGFGIIHRGISPTNIFITEKMELKLVGFGISALRTVGTEMNCEIYSGFSAPEQYDSSGRQGTWTDIYGISAVIYRTLTGQNPPDAKDRENIDKLIPPMMINRNIPQNVSRVLVAGMRMPQEERIQTLSQFVAKLFQPPRLVQPTQGGTAAKKVQTPSGTSSAKKSNKKKQTSKITFIVVGSLFLVIVLVLMFVILFPPTAKESPANTTSSSTTAVTTTKAVTTVPTTGTEEDTTKVLQNAYEIPDFTGRKVETLKKYESALTIVYEYDFCDDEGIIKDQVYDQTIAPKTLVETGTEITVKVSKGPSIVELPDYKGKTIDEYIDILTELNIKYKKKKSTSTIYQPGYVVKCNINVGDEVNVAEGDTVQVYYVPESTTEEE